MATAALLRNPTTTKATRVRSEAPAPAPTPRELAEAAMAEFHSLALQFGSLEACFKASAKELKDKMDAIKAKLQAQAEGDLVPDFNGTKTLHLNFGTIGFKLQAKAFEMPTFDTDEALTVCNDKLLKLVKAHYPAAITEGIDQKKLIAAVEAGQHKPLNLGLKRLAIILKQKENFIVTPKKAEKKPK